MVGIIAVTIYVYTWWLSSPFVWHQSNENLEQRKFHQPI